MANYGTLKAAIDAYIKRNGQQRITGDLLNAVLNAAVDALGMGYQFLGIATAQTDPGTPDARVFYIAGAGTYPNFGSTEIPDGGIGFFCYGDTWEYAVLQVGSGGGGGSEDAVLYTPQTLTTEQKSQARSNIGAGTGNYSKPGTGIPKTDLAEGVQTSLGKADSAYQKPSTGIPSTDIASGVIPTSVVQYTSQSLTDEQKTQARTNIGAGTYDKPSGGIPATDLASGVIPAPEIFWATYGTTTLADITTAYNAGKVVCCNRGGGTYVLANLQSSYCYFGSLNRTSAQFILLSGSSWSAGQSGLEISTNKVSTIVGNEGDTTKFPNCKAVYDYLDGLAETWTFTLANGTSVSKKIIVLPEEEA